jgi:protein ImuA
MQGDSGVIPWVMAKTDATAGAATDTAGRAGPGGATLSEVFPEPGAEAAAAGFVLARLQDRAGPVLWVQDRMARLETGRPTLAGLDGRALLHLCLSRAVDVMVAVEEGLRCPDLSAVIAEVRGEASAISFTALKRIALRSEAAGVPCWLIRQAARADLSAARNRWRIATLPSAPHPDDPRAPGDPRWRLDLFRARDGRPGAWIARHERGAEAGMGPRRGAGGNGGTGGAAHRLDLVAAVSDGALAEAAGTGGQRAAG